MAQPDPQTFFTLDVPADPARVERGRKLFAGPCDFVLGAADLHQLPEPDRLEICLAGRSNAGKSSLINALTGRKALARTSNTPGRTQQLNYFDLGGALYLVDLPGYGFAEAPVSAVRRWGEVLRAYLAGRTSLRRAFVLIDSRHGLKPADHDIMDLLDRAAVPFQVVLTKMDKPKPGVFETVVRAVKNDVARHAAAYPEMIATSSEDGRGIPALRAEIIKLMDS